MNIIKNSGSEPTMTVAWVGNKRSVFCLESLQKISLCCQCNGSGSLAWPTTPLQDGTVWKLSSQNCGSCMSLCRANQNQYSHASSRQKYLLHLQNCRCGLNLSP